MTDKWKDRVIRGDSIVVGTMGIIGALAGHPRYSGQASSFSLWLPASALHPSSRSTFPACRGRADDDAAGTSRHLQDGVAGMDPFSQELRLRESDVQREHVYRDIGVSGATGTDQRQGWHRGRGEEKRPAWNRRMLDFARMRSGRNARPDAQLPSPAQRHLGEFQRQLSGLTDSLDDDSVDKGAGSKPKLAPRRGLGG